MQSTSSNISKSTYQQSQQDTQEDNLPNNPEQTTQYNLNASIQKNNTQDGNHDKSASDKEPAKKPVLVSKPVKIKLDVITSEVEKNPKAKAPTSPRGIKPIPRLQTPEGEQHAKSPRSPRNDQPRNVVENVPKSPGRDDIIKMADSVVDAYRAFGSPRKEQPTPRRLESQRNLDKPQTERALEKTEISEKSATVATTTTNITNTTQDHIITTTDPQPATTMSSEATNKSPDNIAVQPQLDFSSSLIQIDNESAMNFAYQNGGSGALPDQSVYQPGQIFVKVRRKMSMPKVFVPASDGLVTAFAQSARNVKYSKQAQMELLTDMLVAECAGDSINPLDMGSISQNPAPLNLDQLPAEFSEFNSYLKGKNKPTSSHLIHAIFRPDFESSEVWKKAISINDQFKPREYGWTPASGNFEGNFAKQLESMLQVFADDFSRHIFGISPDMKSIRISEEFKDFLFMADKKLVEKLLDQDSRAAGGEKGIHRLSKKNIEQLRAYLFMNILVTRFIKPLLLGDDRSITPFLMTLLRLEINSINKAILELYKDFYRKSFDFFPDSLQKILIKKSEDELKIAAIQKSKDRFSKIKGGYSQRHTRSRSDLGVGATANPLEERARQEYQKRNQRKQLESQHKQINDQLRQILVELEIKEFPRSLAKEIDAVKATWFSIDDEVNNHAVVQHLLRTTRNLIIATKIDKNLMEFEEKLQLLASESLDSRAKRRATMPMSLGDLDFLNNILDQTINLDFSRESNLSNLTSASISSTADDAENTITTTTTTTTRHDTTTTTTTTTDTEIIPPMVIAAQNSLPSVPESNSSGSQQNDLSKLTN